MKKEIRFFLFSSAMLLLVGCSPVMGEWTRFGDTGEGTLVRVELGRGAFQGRLIRVSSRLAGYGFKKNDIKWILLRKVSLNDDRWVGKDLVKTVNFQGRVIEQSYEDVYFTLLQPDEVDRNTLGDEYVLLEDYLNEKLLFLKITPMHASGQPKEEVGTVQMWLKRQ